MLLRVTDNEMSRLVTVVMTLPWVAHVLGQNITLMTSVRVIVCELNLLDITIYLL